MANTETKDESGRLTISVSMGIIQKTKDSGTYDNLMKALCVQIRDTEVRYDGEFIGLEFDDKSKTVQLHFKATTDPRRDDTTHVPICGHCGARKLRLTKDDKTKEKV